MATTTTNLGLTKPALSESADVGVINDNSDKIDAEAGKARANLAAAYNSSSSYAVDDYCTRGGNLYRCTTAIGSGGEAWNSGHWTQITVMDETVNKHGDETISGEKVFDGTIRIKQPRYGVLGFRNSANNTTGFLQLDSGNTTNQTLNRLAFTEYSPKATADTGNTGYAESYRLPSPDAGLSENASYDILTTKEYFKSVGSIAKSSSKSFAVTSNGRFLVMLMSTATNAMGMFIVAVTSAGNVNIHQISLGNNITLSTSTNTLTIANSHSSASTDVIACEITGTITANS